MELRAGGNEGGWNGGVLGVELGFFGVELRGRLN